MNNQFDESSLNEQTINDVETARLALRWSLDKIRALQEETIRAKQNLQEKAAQASFLENQLKGKNSEIEKIIRAHNEEEKSKQDSLEYQLKSRLDRLTEREKELEDKAAKQEEVLKQRETRLLDDYQKKSDELRARWAEVEAELWQLRQEQVLKQQEFEKLYSARLEDERKKAAAELDSVRQVVERTYSDKLADFERREKTVGEEFKKQEAMLKWARDSFQQETAEREKALKQKESDIEKKIIEKNSEIDEYKIKASMLEKQLSELPEAVRRRDEDLNRYKTAMESLESVVRVLENEKKTLREETEHKMFLFTESLEKEKNKYRDMESEIPKRLKTAIEHERVRLAEKLSEVEREYKEDLAKRREEIAYLERNLKTFEETIKSLQAERETSQKKIDQLQTQYNIKVEETAFREKQLQSEYDVRLRVELEKHTGALKSELDSVRGIYEDNLRFKLEEIAHLRRDLETAVNDRLSAQTQSAESRRALESYAVKADEDAAALRERLKAENEKRLASELSEAATRFNAEKQRIAETFEGQLRDARFSVTRQEEEIQRLRTEMIKLEADKNASFVEERQKYKNELQAQSAFFSDKTRAHEEKVAQLNKALEAMKLEKEELILIERERLERLYTEKEKDFDERLARKELELSRQREELIKAVNSRDTAAAELSRAQDEFGGKLKSLNEKLASVEEESRRKLEAAILKEANRSEEQQLRKNQELDLLKAAKENQEETYRRSLDDFRSKLSETVTRFEALKKLAEERGARADALQTELAQATKFSSEESAALSARLAERERDLRALKNEAEALKRSYEDNTLELKRRTEELERSAALSKVLHTEITGLRKISQEYEQSKKVIEQLKEKMQLWKNH